jgi:hypothetical protein
MLNSRRRGSLSSRMSLIIGKRLLDEVEVCADKVKTGEYLFQHLVACAWDVPHCIAFQGEG